MEHQHQLKVQSGNKPAMGFFKRDLIQGKNRLLQTLEGLHNLVSELPLEPLSLRASLHLEAEVASAVASTAAPTTDSHFWESGHSDSESGHHKASKHAFLPPPALSASNIISGRWALLSFAFLDLTSMT